MSFWPFIPWDAQKLVEDVVATKRRAREDAIRKALGSQPGVPTKQDEQYLRADVTEITSKIRSREWRAQDVMAAYIRSAARAHTNTNCLTEILFDRAIQEAKDLDAWIQKASKEELDDKLLLGVPVSLKDMIDVKGYDSSIGFVKYSYKPAEEDATSVRLLRSQGAIPFCKTNVPQTMLAFECSNAVFGKTLNPFSAKHSPGGSSGGEAALLASDGSPLGIGSDIGGSLRIPAHYSGCYAIKPIQGRFPGKGSTLVIPGYEAVKSSFGPMGRSVEDLELCTRAIVNASIKAQLHRTHHIMLPLPYREVSIPERLRIGYFVEDGFIPTSPACARAVQMSIDACKAAGHELIPVTIPTPVKALEIFQALASSDGFSTLLSHLAPKEPVEPALFLPILGTKIPQWLRSFVSWALGVYLAEYDMGRMVAQSRQKPVKEVYEWQKKRNDYAEQVRTLLWEDLKLDAVICPVQASPAVTHGATKRLSPLVLQTVLWNVVDSSVGVLPVTRVDADLDELPAEFGERILEAGTTLLSKSYYDTVYDAKQMHGLPIGIQIVNPAWEDERLLKIMKVVDDAVRAHPRYQRFGPGVYAGKEQKVY